MRCAPDRRLQCDGHVRQQHGPEAICLGERAACLGKASGIFEVQLKVEPIRQRGLKRAVVGGCCLISDPLNLPLAQPSNQSFGIAPYHDRRAAQTTR